MQASSAAIGVLVCGGLMACSGDGPAGDDLEGVRAALPMEVAGWRAVDDGEVYDSESIFAYIDGHAEVYLAYGMRRCLARRYIGPQGEADIVVDLFELDSAANAYGVFTHDRDGEAVDVGQGALLRPGWLSFWKGPWFGSIYAEGESEASLIAVNALAHAASDAISVEGEAPDLVGELPADGLDPRSVRFLHTWEILNSALFVGGENIFSLSSETDAVLGRYRREGGEGWILLVEYPDEATASVAEENARGGGYESRRDGKRLALVLKPATPELADNLLVNALGGAR